MHKIGGVTVVIEDGPPAIDVLQITQNTETEQVARLAELKKRRDVDRHAKAIERIRADAKADANMMPALIEAAEADATVGEMMTAMKGVFGAYDGGPEW